MRKNIVGDRIRIARAIHKPPLSQIDLLAKLQVSGIDFNQSTLSKIENGDRLVTDIELLALSKALKVSIVWLLDDEEVKL